MCGICGKLIMSGDQTVDAATLRRMIALVRHRGPDGTGIYHDRAVGLAHARLSIIDIAGGAQPIFNEDRSVCVVYNGEIYNYPELRAQLLKRGHRFATATDTEVLVHLYEEQGTGLFDDLNGQFAFALWDVRRRQLLLGRDRLGVRPLYYAEAGGALLFGSEVKSLFADPRLQPALDPIGLDQIFTLWSTLPPRTVFRGVRELAPGQFLVARDGTLACTTYWQPSFPPAGERAAGGRARTERSREELLALLLDAVRIRLRADVPVGAYVSGGLDSSFIAAAVKQYFNPGLNTFSVAFRDRHYDESPFQRQMADFLGTAHREVACSSADVGAALQTAVWHAESPLIRTAPAPMYLLSGLVRECGIKVVLTGEGADEVLGGYDLFKEMKIRRFWARRPASHLRPLLLKRIYGYLPNWPRRAPRYLEAFYRAHLGGTERAVYSHLPRWATTSAIKSFYSPAMRQAVAGYDAVAALEQALPPAFAGWSALAQAQYLEIRTLLSGNLLSAQGDRMAMAHGVEGRYPFLDHRVVEFCAALPDDLKLRVLNEKYILKEAARPLLPPAVVQRTKQAYRAPDAPSILAGACGDSVDCLVRRASADQEWFAATPVQQLLQRCREQDPALLGARHHMAVTAVCSTLMLAAAFTGARPAAAGDQRGAYASA
jgi:asparagine synthase (glutamine-hydrolysing)